MNKQKMLNIIYEKIANKELSFGCKVKYLGNVDHNIYYDGIMLKDKMILNKDYNEWVNNFNLEYIDGIDIIKVCDFFILGSDIKIIGHPVMIGDVLDYFEDLYSYGNSNLEKRSNIES